MKELLKVFNYGESTVRIVEKDGQPWFVAKDVCDVLEISNTTQAVDKLDEDERSMFNIGRQGETNIISEPGLYSLVIRSNKPESKQFKRWITHEVLPTIRKTGQYGNPDYSLPATYADALRQLATTIEEKELLEKQNLLNAPKVEAFDTFIDSHGMQSMADVSKALGVGRNTLFEFLRQGMVLNRCNKPYQKYVDRGYFVLKETVRNGYSNAVTLVTPKGIAYINTLLKKKFEISPAARQECGALFIGGR